MRCMSHTSTTNSPASTTGTTGICTSAMHSNFMAKRWASLCHKSSTADAGRERASERRRINVGNLELLQLRGHRLGREVQPQHSAVHVVHVHQSAGHIDVMFVHLLHAVDGKPADPLALAFQGWAGVIDERGYACVLGQFEPQ